MSTNQQDRHLHSNLSQRCSMQVSFEFLFVHVCPVTSKSNTPSFRLKNEV